jgi:(R,R)-butanediol dehydrogenase/meso-butanediol dehydrogenase/diacetyl reductase
VNANAIVERELDIRGCSVFCEEQREVLPLLASLTSKLERVTASSIPLEQLPLEYERLISG